MKRCRGKKVAAVGLMAAVFTAGTSAAWADNPHAGNSGHFKGTATPCRQNERQCPPQSGK